MVFLYKLTNTGSRFISGLKLVSLITVRPTSLNNVSRYSNAIRYLSSSSVQNPPPPPPNCPSDATKSDSFDAFRAREEKREEEFETSYNASKSEDKQTTSDKSSVDDDGTSVKLQILQAALNFVKTDGWSKEALANGALQCELPSVAHGMFPRGGVELVEYYNAECNKNLIEEMKKMDKEENVYDTPTKFVTKAVELRLRMILPYKDNWPQALALMSLPPNVPISLSNLLTMVDDICYYAGDRSVDFNWYTRRIGLASIFKATEFFMLQDKSPDHHKTWEFLAHRIEDASKMQDFLKHSESLTKGIQQTGKSIFDTARNILGLNFNRR